MLDRIADRGSDGVILKAPDHPLVAAAVARLAEHDIPVVTFVTDLPGSRRAAYVGVDNRAAGATAAYLVTSWARHARQVLVTLSSSSFHGEEEREVGFRAAMVDLAPRWTVHEVTDTDGLDATMRAAVRGTLEAEPGIAACYSIGGGNRAILDVFDELGRTPRCSSPTTSTRTTGGCSAPDGSRRCSTTTCGPTCAAPAGCCSRRAGCCRAARPACRRRSRW